MNRWMVVPLTLAVVVVAWGDEQRAVGVWRLLQPPRFRTLQGTVQVSVFAERRGDRVWTMEIWADEQRSRTQVTLPHPEGSRQIITITTTDAVWILLPFAKRAIRRTGITLPSWRDLWGFRSDKLDLAQRNYTLRILKRESVAGLPCLVLELIPKFRGNPIRRLWVHPPTRLPLQLERYSPDGKLEIRVAFTDIKINQPLPLLIFDTSLPSDWQQVDAPVRRSPLPLANAEAVLGFPLLMPAWVPPGYVLDGAFVIQDRRWKVAHILYTDGISVISVFEHPAPSREQRFGPPKRRHGGEAPPPPAMRMFPQQWLRREIGQLQVVLVAETTREWLERMADSLQDRVATER
ncbi:hypothetical protein HRbin17_00346 [bacterium HR17]|jgi:negative regulator of sigma E activity|uniref:MucB/RseB N-terminal domain-containing protein n=1 Tax=Candidatus Fervidibacter japonicus TaxID=2035412 RepID=A0A2H5X9I2_9BACT|nr:hypothetical protein HRbin17_00346 [bacterium HR17]